ncbi:hypothetical protein TBK1r_72980 [Stieleria magnilauensis]|uniref:Uncharacterized protein n=1 Tax=Stieleria magnilauensis TaxID=2527963 RepID=A0ABX5Y431_9BACT|nr:hypothetical protein TBK1r_72980 [Planctomycetes bacterium TBK1r]
MVPGDVGWSRSTRQLNWSKWFGDFHQNPLRRTDTPIIIHYRYPALFLLEF